MVHPPHYSLKLPKSIIMEHCNNGDLYQKIVKHQKKRKLFKESEIWQILIQTVKALKALHDKKVFHRDLKVGFFISC